jgi:hypothetical protein
VGGQRGGQLSGRLFNIIATLTLTATTFLEGKRAGLSRRPTISLVVDGLEGGRTDWWGWGGCSCSWAQAVVRSMDHLGKRDCGQYYQRKDNIFIVSTTRRYGRNNNRQ